MALQFLLPGNLADALVAALAAVALDAGPTSPPGQTVAMTCSAPAPRTAMMFQQDAAANSQLAGTASPSHVLYRAPDGLFYIDGVVNGARIHFLVDTGATTIVLTQADAARAGVRLTKASFNATANTAGGDTAMARVRLARLVVGESIDFDVDAVVAGNGLGVSLLGASWLTQIGSLTIAGDRMTLQ